VRQHGVLQFLATFQRVRARANDVLKWGDEIEYHLVRFDAGSRRTTVELRAPEVVAALEAEDKARGFAVQSAWRPEYGSWMVEATPGVPYGSGTSDLRTVEANMAVRRFRIAAAAGPHVVPMSIVSYPLLGVGCFTSPATSTDGAASPFSRSAYVSDAAISPHPRFGTLTANIRHRRGRKVEIQVPLFADTATDTAAAVTGGAAAACGAAAGSTGAAADAAATEATVFAAEAGDAAVASGAWAADGDVGPAYVPRPGHIHMDAMAFGMGCCCLQVTFQARDLAESRLLYDALAIISPLMMALTANAPIWRGHLGDHDTRWDVIAASVDCRTPAEAGAPPDTPAPGWMAGAGAAEAAAGGGVRRITKSRYSSVDAFISDSPNLADAYNDVPLAVDEDALATLVAAGVDDRLARHIAHLFIRDPLVIFKERVGVDDARTTEHFENIQSTNWRSVRWKPPPPDAPDMGWRVELRTMEAQLTDFENAAFTVFVVLLSRVILSFDLNLYLPLSLVDANFERAKARRAADRGRFWFRRNLKAGAPVLEEMSLAGILLGAPATEAAPERFPGLVPLIYRYLGRIGCDDDTRKAVDHYLRFIVGRATGEIMTGATWQRTFVASHPEYRHDSVVPATVVHDLLAAMADVAAGTRPAPDLLGAAAPPVFVITADMLELPPRSLATAVYSSPGAAAGAAAGAGAGAAAAGGAGARTLLRSDAAPGVAMRGRSFVDEMRESVAESTFASSLVERSAVHEGTRFEDVRPFLPPADADAGAGGGDGDDGGSDSGSDAGGGGGASGAVDRLAARLTGAAT